MPACRPEEPNFTSAGERAVWHKLRGQLAPGDLLVANQRVTAHDKDHEVDLVVAREGGGVVCVEVKGGEV